jgi:hypothetical protein
MAVAKASTPSLASLYLRMPLATVRERPTGNLPAPLPPVDLPRAATPQGPVPPASSIMSTTILRSEVAAATDVSMPATLPVVDWTFVAATPPPPHRHSGASLVEVFVPPAGPGLARR